MLGQKFSAAFRRNTTNVMSRRRMGGGVKFSYYIKLESENYSQSIIIIILTTILSITRSCPAAMFLIRVILHWISGLRRHFRLSIR